MRRPWADLSSDSALSLSHGKPSLFPKAVDLSFSTHIAPTHTHELENSKSGLNILLQRASLDHNSIGKFEECSLKKRAIKWNDQPNVISEDLADLKDQNEQGSSAPVSAVDYQLQQPLVSSIRNCENYEHSSKNISLLSSPIKSVTKPEQTASLLSNRWKNNSYFGVSSGQSHSSGGSNVRQLRPFSNRSIDRCLGGLSHEMSALTPAKRTFDDSIRDDLSSAEKEKCNEQVVAHTASATFDSIVEDTTTQNKVYTMDMPICQNVDSKSKKVQKIAVTKSFGGGNTFQSGVESFSNACLQTISTKKKKHVTKKKSRRSINGIVNTMGFSGGDPNLLSASSAANSMQLYCCASPYGFLPVFIPATTINTPIQFADGVRSKSLQPAPTYVMNATVPNVEKNITAKFHVGEFSSSSKMQSSNEQRNESLGFTDIACAEKGNYPQVSSSIASNEEQGAANRRLDSRLKAIAVGKSTSGYRNYIRKVLKGDRTDSDPVTPNPTIKMSASEFKAKCQVWRRSLHKFDK